MNTIDSLSEYFKKFPGIGSRQAKRFVYFLLHQNPSYLNEITALINSLKKEVAQCPSCFIFHHSQNKTILCKACNNPEANREFLMILEKDTDYENFHGSNFYKGLYFILGGLVPIVEKTTSQNIRIRELLKVVEERLNAGELKEIILALSLNPQGENTDMYLRQNLSPLSEKYGLKISSLGRGLSTGLELEYSDSETLKNALKNRS